MNNPINYFFPYMSLYFSQWGTLKSSDPAEIALAIRWRAGVWRLVWRRLVVWENRRYVEIMGIYGKNMGKKWEKYRKHMGKIWEKYGKNIGNIWEKYGNLWENPLNKLMHGGSYNWENPRTKWWIFQQAMFDCRRVQKKPRIWREFGRINLKWWEVAICVFP